MKARSVVGKPPLVRRPRRSSAEIRARILEAATDAFNERGYAGATTAAIARRADVTEVQLFRSFGSKPKLFREAVFAPLDRHFSEFSARQIGDATSTMSHDALVSLYMVELIDFIARHSRLLLSYVVARTYDESSGEVEVEIESLSRYFDRGAAMMASRVGDQPGPDPRMMVRASFAAVLGNILFKDWLFPSDLSQNDIFEEAMITFVKHGIGKEPD